MGQDAIDEPLDAADAGRVAVRGGVLRSGGYAIGILLSLIAVPVLGRVLGKDELGVYVTITAIVAVVSGASELGLTSVGVREWASRERSARRELLADLLGARMLLTSVGVLAALGFAFAAGYGPTKLTAVVVACVALLITAVQAALVVPLAATLRQGRIAAADVLRQGVQVAGILLVAALGGGLVWLLAAGIPAAVASLWLSARGTPEGLVVPRFRPARWWAMLRDTLPFAAASAISVLYLRATLIITSLVAGAGATGDFSVAFRVLEVLINVPSLVVGSIFPLLARAAANDPARLRVALDRTWAGAFAAGGLVAVTVAVGAPVAVLIVLGDRPDGAVDALRILGAGLGFSFVGAACQYGLLALRRHADILVINAGALTLNVVLTLLLASSHGAVGAAIALCVSEVAVMLLATVLLIRAGGMRLDLGVAVRVLAAVAVGVVVALLAAPLGILAAAVLAPLCAFGVALALGAIPEELLALVPGRGA